jgi:hypothetical protein
MRSALIGLATITAALTACMQSGRAQESFLMNVFARGLVATREAPSLIVRSIPGNNALRPRVA